MGISIQLHWASNDSILPGKILFQKEEASRIQQRGRILNQTLMNSDSMFSTQSPERVRDNKCSLSVFLTVVYIDGTESFFDSCFQVLLENTYSRGFSLGPLSHDPSSQFQSSPTRCKAEALRICVPKLELGNEGKSNANGLNFLFQSCCQAGAWERGENEGKRNPKRKRGNRLEGACEQSSLPTIFTPISRNETWINWSGSKLRFRVSFHLHSIFEEVLRRIQTSQLINLFVLQSKIFEESEQFLPGLPTSHRQILFLSLFSSHFV